jgi:hypothetical protein
MDLVFDMHISCGMADKNAFTRIHLIRICLSVRSKEATLGRANKMVDRNVLAHEQLILFNVASIVVND